MGECIDLMSAVMKALAESTAVQPLRSMFVVKGEPGFLALMPAMLGDPRVLGVKVLSIFPRNEGGPKSAHQGAVLLFDRDDGRPLAFVDATSITEIRTAATSAVATRALAREDCSTLAVLGAGPQAHAHAIAMHLVRPVSRIRLWSRTAVHARALGAQLQRELGGSVDAQIFDTPAEAVRGADLVCTTTSAREPIVQGSWIEEGTHINAVGAATPGFRELDTTLVARCRLYVDRRESTRAEADEYRVPIAEGAIQSTHILGELGEVLVGRTPGRRDRQEVTLFKSVGLAVEDLASAYSVFARAQAKGRGLRIEDRPEPGPGPGGGRAVAA
jgi:alanine dehydrogenase